MYTGQRFFGATAVTLTSHVDVHHNNNVLKELNDCIGGLLHIGLNVITFRTLLHLGLYYI